MRLLEKKDHTHSSNVEYSKLVLIIGHLVTNFCKEQILWILLIQISGEI